MKPELAPPAPAPPTLVAVAPHPIEPPTPPPTQAATALFELGLSTSDETTTTAYSRPGGSSSGFSSALFAGSFLDSDLDSKVGQQHQHQHQYPSMSTAVQRNVHLYGRIGRGSDDGPWGGTGAGATTGTTSQTATVATAAATTTGHRHHLADAPRSSYKPPEVVIISDSDSEDASGEYGGDVKMGNYRTTTASSNAGTTSGLSPASSTISFPMSSSSAASSTAGRRSQKRPRGSGGSGTHPHVGSSSDQDSVASQRRRVIHGGFIDDDGDADEYVPPAQPIVKPKDIRVRVVYDRYPHHGAGSGGMGHGVGSALATCDDADGHYIVEPNAPFTDRYEIRELLGQGTFGKVVSAYDRQTRRHCAIKIIRSVQKYREASQIELRVLTALSMYDRNNANKCIQLRECFDYRNHVCIVTDLLGLSVYDFMKGNAFLPFPGSHIQVMARQLLKSVAFLHDLNLVHTDLKPENILLETDDNIERPYRARRSRSAPKQRKILLNTAIHLIDFGSAIFNDEYHSSVVSTRHYRAPEIILGTGWSFPCDMWSIGCILVELCTGTALFQTHNNAEHLALMEKVLGGKLDRHIAQMAVCNATGAALIRRDTLDVMYPEATTTKSSRKYVASAKSFDKLIMSCVDYARDPEFWSAFIDLLGQILVYDPAQRITARQALAHPWFKQHISDDGSETRR